MSAPREHVEAVADVMSPKGLPYYRNVGGWGLSQAGQSYIKRAEKLLTSTDPAVHAAMLDALVRAGVLSEERREVAVVGKWQTVKDKKGRVMRVPAERLERHLVTEWEASHD